MSKASTDFLSRPLGNESEIPKSPTRLITDPVRDLPKYTATQETDALTALTRGLAEYLSQQSWTDAGGRPFKFNKVLNTWSEPESETDFPSLVVLGKGPGMYDKTKWSPDPDTRNQLPLPDGRFLVQPTEFVQDLSLDIWTTDSVARHSIVAMVEAAMTASPFMYGIRLELPHYFNMRADFELMDMAYGGNDPENAMERYRMAFFTVKASVPVVRLAAYPMAKPQVTVRIAS